MATKSLKKIAPIFDMPLSALDDTPLGPITLTEAFSALAQALLTHYEVRENVQVSLHIEDVQRMHADGNVLIAWSHLIPLLEGALGAQLVRH